ncbi:hypothetical protein VTH06DRAFT_4715, partial [Thermothelomyces fergusii]
MALLSFEAVFLILSALSPSLRGHLAAADKLRARIARSRGAGWALGIVAFAVPFLAMGPAWTAVFTGRTAAEPPAHGPLGPPPADPLRRC